MNCTWSGCREGLSASPSLRPRWTAGTNRDAFSHLDVDSQASADVIGDIDGYRHGHRNAYCHGNPSPNPDVDTHPGKLPQGHRLAHLPQHGFLRNPDARARAQLLLEQWKGSGLQEQWVHLDMDDSQLQSIGAARVSGVELSKVCELHFAGRYCG